ncbi:MAG: cation:proton antiporter [Deltaproteobacteria bacterium]|nr:cation:proton antiporter [Nannocystaceae bacterium]
MLFAAAAATTPFIGDLALALGVAAVTSVLCRRLHQPAVLGYLIAGLIVGPYLALPLFADPARIHALSEFGVVLVMFGIGLHFGPRELARAIPKAGLMGLAQVSAMLWLGFMIGQAFGWTTVGSIFLGATVAISSTMVVAKALDEHPLADEVSELVFGVLVIQDLVAVVLIAALTSVASGAGLEPVELAITTGKLFGFLAVLVIVGLLVVPRAVRMIARMGHGESLLIAAVGLCFVLSLLAAEAGYSVALGAFVAGSLVAESGEGPNVERMVTPLRDVFAAVFFVSIGMTVDPRLALVVWPQVLAIAAVVILGQLVVLGMAVFLGGHGIRRGVQVGLALGQIGEFSFILAQTGAEVTDPALIPALVMVAIITATTTPMAIARADRIAARIDRALPSRVHTVAALYESWVESLRSARDGRRVVGVRRFARLALIDTVAIAAIIIGGALARAKLDGALTRLGVPMELTDVLVGSLTILLCVPFVIGLMRCVRAFGATMARVALPHAAADRTDLAMAPRRVLVVVIQLAALMALVLPLLALTGPFLPPWLGAPVLLLILGVVAVSFWRRADDLVGHVRAGAEVVVELLRQSAGERESFAAQNIERTLPGLGEITPVVLPAGSAACGHTLAELDLRGKTGATVLAIERGGEGRTVPHGNEPLQAGDVLALVGTHDAIARATALLEGELQAGRTAGG